MSLFHFHRWQVVAAQPCADVSFGLRTDGTNVLSCCTTCGKPRSTWVQGHWTAEQLRGES